MHIDRVDVGRVALYQQGRHRRLEGAIRLGDELDLIDVTFVGADDQIIRAREAVERFDGGRLASAIKADGHLGGHDGALALLLWQLDLVRVYRYLPVQVLPDLDLAAASTREQGRH